MGLTNRIFGERKGDEQDDDPDKAEWRVVARHPEKKTNASLPDGLDDKEWHYSDPPTKEQFRFDYGDILEGDKEYICAPKDGQYIDLDNIKWCIEAEEKVRERRKRQRKTEKKLEKKIEGMEERLGEVLQENATASNPEEIKAHMQAQILQLAAKNPGFIARYGGDIALSALDVDRHTESAVGYEEFKDNPMQAMFYELASNPEKARDLGQNFGGGLGAVVDGFVEGAGQAPEPRQNGDAAASQDDSQEWEPRDIDSGPQDLEDLDIDVSDEAQEIADNIQRLTKRKQQLEREQEGRSDAGGAGTDAAERQDSTGTQSEPGEFTEQEQRAAEISGEHAMVDASQGAETGDAATQADDDPMSAEPDLDPDKCQHVKDDGTQCGLPPTKGSDYCHTDGHGPPDDDADQSSGDDDEKIKSPQAGIEEAKEELENAG